MNALRRRGFPALLLALATLSSAACGDGELGEAVSFTVPDGASFHQVVDTLRARGLVGGGPFEIYARIRGDDRRIRSGRYDIPEGAGWGRILDALVAGNVATVAVTIPEGWTVRQMAGRLGPIPGLDSAAVASVLEGDSAHLEWEVPGPGLEGYLFPETYRFAEGLSLDAVIEAMVGQYRSYWTPERRARLDSLDLSEREIVTLASIVQAEAAVESEMPRIASVYTNRVRDGWLLQADPTVLYALGGPRERLLFAAIDSVADSPYNTYRQPGLPPGPIGAPGAAALDATLWPEESEYYYFVVGPTGEHVFSETLAEHNRAVAEYRRRRNAAGS